MGKKSGAGHGACVDHDPGLPSGFDSARFVWPASLLETDVYEAYIKAVGRHIV